MSKAVIIVDMPESCDMCNFIDEMYHYCNVPWFGKDVSDYVACRHEDCPLCSLPQIANHPDYWDNGRYDKGWNDCLNEILKGEEHETD